MSEWQPAEWNTALKPWRDAAPSNRGGAGSIEDYREIRNLEWQSRSAPPTEYENHLAEALEQILGDGIHDLPGIVAGLNRMRVHSPMGRAWTDESFAEEIKRLGV